MTAILGISAFYHDSAAALVVDGKVVAAAQEERFTRKKFDEQFPKLAIDYCLRETGLKAEHLDYVGFYDKPFLKYQRLLETYLSFAPEGFSSFKKAMPLWLNQKLHLPREIDKGLGGAYKKKFVFTQHHESHAASAFYPSPFEEAAILTLDGVGEWATASFGYGKGNQIALTHELHFPHSLGLLYSAFTYYCGFSVNSGEFKLMGLAPYGTPRFESLIRGHLIDLKEDGSFRMDMSYFNYCQGLTMTSDKFHRLFGGPPRQPDSRLTERDMDLAASVQKVAEDSMLRCARHVHAQTGMKNLCLAGGVALNCVGNGRLMREGPFERIWIQPAAGDAGGALGTALFVWHQLLDHARVPVASDSQSGSLLGPEFSAREIQTLLDSTGVRYEKIEDEEAFADCVAREIEEGRVVGWFQGRMEFGPRALGSRSIIGDPRNPAMQAVINLKVKFREGFRPFAPAVLVEKASEYFEVPEWFDNPYMLVVAPVSPGKRVANPGEAGVRGIDKLKLKRSEIPAVTHVDYSARIQTVDLNRHGAFRQLLEAFYRRTGCPVLVNTSFNLGWAPIVCTPRDAYQTFMSCDIDVLAIGPFVVRKAGQTAWVPPDADSNDVKLIEGLLECPCGSGEPLRYHGDALVSQGCQHRFPVTDGIPQLYWPQDRTGGSGCGPQPTEIFHEEPDFPKYNDLDSIRSFIETMRKNRYARLLQEAIPYNASVLEVGCRTGHLANFLGTAFRRVIGTDLGLDSLRLANRFRQEQGLNRVRFLQANLSRLPFRESQFDVILVDGGFQRAGDPRRGFEEVVHLLKPGGHIVAGLPGHTGGEAPDWFGSTDVEFVRCVPPLDNDERPLEEISLFTPEPQCSAWSRLWFQARNAITRNRGGGFFMLVGRKPDAPQAEQHELDRSTI